MEQDLQKVAIEIPHESIFTPELTGVTYAVIGKSFSGKTTFIVNELNKLTPEQVNVYNAIIFFTESAFAQPLKDLSAHVRQRMLLTDRFCPQILQILKKLNDETKNSFKFLVIFDDIIQLRGVLLTKAIITLRNSNISTVISVQYEKLLNPAQRSSVHNIYLFNLRTPSWEFLLKGFIVGNIKEILPSLADENNVVKIAQQLRQNMDNYILYYDQRRDEIAFWKKAIKKK